MQAEVVDSVIATCNADESSPSNASMIKGRASDTLIKAADGAAMLVVGNREAVADSAGLLLGSVSHQIAQHASCPVVIVRADLEDLARRPGRRVRSQILTRRFSSGFGEAALTRFERGTEAAVEQAQKQPLSLAVCGRDVDRSTRWQGRIDA